MANKSPYRFPARSRAAMITAIQDIGHRRYYRPNAWPFCWNVKLDWSPDFTARELNPTEGANGPLDPALDDAWESYCEASEGLFWGIAEDMARNFTDSEYSTYPGDDAGAFEFGFEGRCGGWLVLRSAYGRNMADLDLDDLADTDEWSFPEIRALYRAVVCMERDFSRERVKAEYQFHCAYRRGEWEREKREREAELRASLVANCQKIRELNREIKQAAGALPETVESVARAEIKRLASDCRAALAELRGDSE